MLLETTVGANRMVRGNGSRAELRARWAALSGPTRDRAIGDHPLASPALPRQDESVKFILSFLLLAIVPLVAQAEPPSSSPVIPGTGLEAFAAKAEAGDKVHVAFLGGSITQNASGHSRRVPAALETLYPKAEFAFTRAGLGSTCSTSGAFRWRDHLLSKGAIDLLVVEFAVNDDQDAAHAPRECIRGMEGIVRGVLVENPDTGIVMIHYLNESMLAKTRAGEVPVSVAAHQKVADHYGIPVADVMLAVAQAVESGDYDWKKYGGTHPGAFGYEVASQLVMDVIQASLAAAGTRPESLPAPLDAASYVSGGFIDPAAARPTGEWTRGHPSREVLGKGGFREDYASWPLLRSSTAGDSLKLHFEGTVIGAWVLAGPDAGIVETRIDGDEWTETQLFHRHSGGLHYPRSVVFGAGLAEGKHVLELRISAEQPKGSSGTTASILQFLAEKH